MVEISENIHSYQEACCSSADVRCVSDAPVALVGLGAQIPVVNGYGEVHESNTQYDNAGKYVKGWQSLRETETVFSY